MTCSKTGRFLRPSTVIAAIFVVASCSFMVHGTPIPQDGKTIESHINEGVKVADDFITRTKNTLTGKADPNTPTGLTHLELAAVIAGAVVLGFIAFCCIGYCLCECVKELICCICCCKCCRD